MSNIKECKMSLSNFNNKKWIYWKKMGITKCPKCQPIQTKSFCTRKPVAWWEPRSLPRRPWLFVELFWRRRLFSLPLVGTFYRVVPSPPLPPFDVFGRRQGTDDGPQKIVLYRELWLNWGCIQRMSFFFFFIFWLRSGIDVFKGNMGYRQSWIECEKKALIFIWSIESF